MPASPSPANPSGPVDPSIRRTWLLLVAGFVLLGASLLARVLAGPDVLDWISVVAGAVVALAAFAHRDAVARLEQRRRGEAESFARILHGLSRSVSADAIVAAIVTDLADAVGADHIVAIRRRPDGVALEATLVTHRPGVPPTTTVLPPTDLDGPAAEGDAAAQARRAAEEVAVHGPGTSLPPASASLPRRALGEAVALLGDVGLPIRPRREPDAGPRAEILGGPMDAAAVVRVTRRVRALHGLANTLSAPLRTEQGLVGAIVVSRRTHDAWPASAARLLLGAASEASSALSRAHTFREAAVGAQTDALTGLPNRRYFEEFMGLLARRRRAGDAVAVLMIDIDRFKALNDAHGHGVGDLALRAVAEAIARTVRDDDVPARIGGEEFAVLLRNAGPDVATEVGERVRQAVRALDLSAVGVNGVTVSVGVAVARPGETIPDVVERADAALLRAKRAGRDRTVGA